MANRLLQLLDATRRAVLDGEGTTDPTLRRQVAAGDPPPDLATLVRKIRDRAYAVTDEDVKRLRSQYSEDQIFEIVLSATIGAAGLRLKAATDALEGA